MKMKKRLVSLAVTLTAIVLVSSPVLAGSKQRHRWEGLAIGVGAAILGHAIYQAHQAPPPTQRGYVAPGPARHYRNHVSRHRHGHWTWQKTWVAPSFEKVWNPGHYNRKGRWVSGHWIEIKTSKGHWTHRRVWIANNSRHDHCYEN